MRKFVTAAVSGAALLGVAAIAVAAGPEDRSPQASAYLSFKFGQAQGIAQPFFYGLRLEHDARTQVEAVDAGHALPSIAQLEFRNRAFSSASVNGLPFARRLSLNQDEGFEAPSDGGEGGESSGGGETTYTAIDWSLLVVGAVGLGFVVAEIADTDESSDPPGGTTTGGTTDGTTTGGTTGGLLGGLLGDTTGGGTTGGTTGTTGGLLGGLLGLVDNNPAALEYERALDGGTGHMGDLIAQP